MKGQVQSPSSAPVKRVIGVIGCAVGALSVWDNIEGDVSLAPGKTLRHDPLPKIKNSFTSIICSMICFRNHCRFSNLLASGPEEARAAATRDGRSGPRHDRRNGPVRDIMSTRSCQKPFTLIDC